MTKPFGVALLSGFALLSTASFADSLPPKNISPANHEHLARAQQGIDESYREIDEAEKNAKSDLGGHLSNAKSLLQQADAEIKAAAEVANDLKQEKHR